MAEYQAFIVEDNTLLCGVNPSENTAPKMFFYKILLTLLLALPILSTAQVQDDFSDGDLSNNPTWQGDVANFTVNANFELQLDAPEAGTSILYVPALMADSAIWELFFHLDFAPSTSNNLHIVLQSDSDTLATGNGYSLYMGESGSDDAIEFYRWDNGNETLLASGTIGAVASSPKVRMKMIRENGGNWTLLADYSGGFNFSEEFQITDATHGGGNHFFGFICEYTSTRVDKFFFDDINVAPLLPDLEPPVLLSAVAISATEVDVFFNEALDEVTATDPANYNINNGIGMPAAAFLDGADASLVHLSLQNPLVSQTDYELTVENVTDLAGNDATSQSAAFTFIEIEMPEVFDVLINEIMADPSPEVALPPVEFIELYNRSDKVLNLEGYGFSSGGTPQLFPDYLLPPDSYVIVCDDSDADTLAGFGEVIGLFSFPSLVNGGDDLALLDPTGAFIHALSYSINDYGNPQKEEGGWTLELINPLAPCQGNSNWSASVSLLGGTPGQPNSILDAFDDTLGPDITRAFAAPDRPFEIKLFFNEGLDKVTAEDISNYTLNGSLEILSATLEAPANNVVSLLLTTPLETSFIYEVTLSDGLTDCSGNPIAQSSATFSLPETIDPMDIVINEILFNPVTGGVDFVEIYNRSGKVFNLGDLFIGNIRPEIDTVIRAVQVDRLLLPNAYAVFTPSPSGIRNNYSVQVEEALFTNELPGFNNDEGNVTLFRTDGAAAVIIDAFDYSETLHHPLLDDPDGVSLERLSPDDATQDPNNWHSAAATAGFATPTYQNSQSILSSTAFDDFFEITEKKLSPDGDGFQDFLVVNYQFDQPGYTAQAKIFDAEGRQVKTLFNNELFGTEGFFRWDGETDRGEKARIGIYILWIELFHPDGTVREFTETCVVATMLGN